MTSAHIFSKGAASSRRPFVLMSLKRHDRSSIAGEIADRPRLARTLPALRRGTSFPGLPGVASGLRALRTGLRFADAGDGPAIFVILIGGGIVVFASLITEVLFQPPYWLHALMWLPLILIVTLAPLRFLKGLLIALQYHHKAAEGRIERRGDA